MNNYAPFDERYSSGSPEDGSGSSTTVPNININGSRNSPVNAEFYSRSLDIKKQLSQSFQGDRGVSHGGVGKPRSRRNSAYHVKSEDEGNDSNGDKEEQGNERKRRDNINEKIQELLQLIPASYFLELAKDGPVNSDDAVARSTGTKDGKPNKGQILTRAVEYIQFLQNKIDEDNRKEVELFLKVKTLELEQQGQRNIPISVGVTSAEKALGEIGVGPDSDDYFHRVLQEAATGRKKET